MVLEPHTRTLFIFAGQRDEKYLSDLYSYDIATNTATELYSDFSAAGGPDPCFTQRAVIDPNLREIYVQVFFLHLVPRIFTSNTVCRFCGLMRGQQAGATTILAGETPNWMFTYDQRPGTWTQILPQPMYPSHKSQLPPGEPTAIEEPLPRYAAQVVYNPDTKTVFMHGGNMGIVGQMERRKAANAGEGAGDGAHQEERLDDLWQMTLIRRVLPVQIHRSCFLI